MVNFLYPHGAVYIFENTEAKRVKVGMTAIGVNDVADRLKDVNDMWLERKVTCQICGRRCVNVGGHVPPHVGNVREDTRYRLRKMSEWLSCTWNI
jgi:hypothetical protein